ILDVLLRYALRIKQPDLGHLWYELAHNQSQSQSHSTSTSTSRNSRNSRNTKSTTPSHPITLDDHLRDSLITLHLSTQNHGHALKIAESASTPSSRRGFIARISAAAVKHHVENRDRESRGNRQGEPGKYAVRKWIKRCEVLAGEIIKESSTGTRTPHSPASHLSHTHHHRKSETLEVLRDVLSVLVFARNWDICVKLVEGVWKFIVEGSRIGFEGVFEKVESILVKRQEAAEAIRNDAFAGVDTIDYRKLGEGSDATSKEGADSKSKSSLNEGLTLGSIIPYDRERELLLRAQILELGVHALNTKIDTLYHLADQIKHPITARQAGTREKESDLEVEDERDAREGEVSKLSLEDIQRELGTLKPLRRN
ncbi:hypothetical protein HK102_012320, partial [Quaeritorhiza haematococci]